MNLTETVKLDDDYNVFYSAVTSTSDAAELLAPSIYQGAAGEAITAVHYTVEDSSPTWANLTRPPPPQPKKNKNKGVQPTPPPPKYIYGTNRTWLTASIVSTIGEQTLKELVDALIATPGYFASFATLAFESGAARGQFQSDPLPPPPKDKKGGKDGGKNGGGKAGRMPPTVHCFLSVVLRLRAGRLSTRLSGSDADLNGDGNTTGSIGFVVYLNTTTYDYNILYGVGVALTDAGEPTSVVIKKGGDVALTVTTSDATWTNRTVSNAERAKLTPKGKKGMKPPLPPPFFPYTYETSV
ncbi:unnamed protein product [Closterium sp. NIES-64]|nr:unnamed protein product [Closterium sp. NIES-64]